MKKCFTILILCFSLNAFSQPFINFFSEDGYKFWVVIEGKKINTTPKYRVDSITLQHDWAKVKIIFENPDLPSIDKTVMYFIDDNGKKGSVTYNIKRNNRNKWVVRPCSWEQGDPNQNFVFQNTANNTTTTITPTNNTTTTTTTTTITTTTNTNGGNIEIKIDETSIDGRDTRIIAPPPPGIRKAMSDADFANALNSISKKNFENDRLSLAKQIINSNYFTSAQVVQIIKLMSFENSRLDVAKTAYLRTIDKNNYFMVNDAFSFSSSVDELEEYINSMK